MDKKKTKKILKVVALTVGSIVLAAKAAHAQKYGNALGVRFGDGNVYRSAGLTFQQRVMPRVTLEGIVETDFTHNTTGHILIERHMPIVSRRLNYYMGTGFSLGNEQSTYTDKATGYTITKYGNTTFGTDLMAGIEITMLKYNISVDYRPNFNLVGRENWYQGQVAVSARAVIMSGAAYDKKRRIKQREQRKEGRTERRQELIGRIKTAL